MKKTLARGSKRPASGQWMPSLEGTGLRIGVFPVQAPVADKMWKETP